MKLGGRAGGGKSGRKDREQRLHQRRLLDAERPQRSRPHLVPHRTFKRDRDAEAGPHGLLHRLGAAELHGAQGRRAFVSIDELPDDEALALIERYQPDGQFHSHAEREAAIEIVTLLGRFTVAIEAAAVI